MKHLRLTARVGADVLRARLRRSSAAHAVLVNALPKSGTHLLIGAMERLPDVARIRLQVSQMNASLFRARAGEASVQGGVAFPLEFSRARVRRWLALVPAGAFATAHLPWSEELAALLRSLDMRTVVMVRDPRDVAASSAAYIASQPRHPLHARFRDLSAHERLRATMEGLPEGANHPRLAGVRERVASMLGWTADPSTLVVRFENLVGRRGGGSDAAQLDVLGRIASHVGSSATPEQLSSTAAGIFGGSDTFRRGQIGGWRDAYSVDERRMATDLLGDLLPALGYPGE